MSSPAPNLSTTGASIEGAGAEAARAEHFEGAGAEAARAEHFEAAGAEAARAEHFEAADPEGARAEQLIELGQAFRRVFVSLRRLRGRDTHLCAGELSHAQFELLIELHDRGELPAGELASAAQLTPATVTQMLDHLASSGYVERDRLPGDRRVVLARLTDSGRAEIETRRDRKRERWERALADVDGAELQAATRVLARLSAVFDED